MLSLNIVKKALVNKGFLLCMAEGINLAQSKKNCK